MTSVCRLEALDASTTEARAAQLLHGLGFTKTMQQKRTRDFSGGWRMRIALARALFVDPTFLILDGKSWLPEWCPQIVCWQPNLALLAQDNVLS